MIPKVSGLLSLLAINLMKWIYRFFKQSLVLILFTWSKSHVGEPLTLSQQLAYCGVDRSSAGGDMHLSCDPTRPLRRDVMCIYGWELLTACHDPESLVTIGILIAKRKNALSKPFYKYVLTLKNCVDWITTMREKNVSNMEMVHFEKKCPEIKKKQHIFPLWLPSVLYS